MGVADLDRVDRGGNELPLQIPQAVVLFPLCFVLALAVDLADGRQWFHAELLGGAGAHGGELVVIVGVVGHRRDDLVGVGLRVGNARWRRDGPAIVAFVQHLLDLGGQRGAAGVVGQQRVDADLARGDDIGVGREARGVGHRPAHHRQQAARVVLQECGDRTVHIAVVLFAGLVFAQDDLEQLADLAGGLGRVQAAAGAQFQLVLRQGDGLVVRRRREALGQPVLVEVTPGGPRQRQRNLRGLVAVDAVVEQLLELRRAAGRGHAEVRQGIAHEVRQVQLAGVRPARGVGLTDARAVGEVGIGLGQGDVGVDHARQVEDPIGHDVPQTVDPGDRGIGPAAVGDAIAVGVGAVVVVQILTERIGGRVDHGHVVGLIR